MTTPFDLAIEAIAQARYHNHRLEMHSDVVSKGLVADLRVMCPAFAADLDGGVVRMWPNVSAPGDRERKVDLFIGEPDADGNPDITRVRLAIENKSVITAHRNRTNRFDDLKKVLNAVHGARPEAILIATVLVGVAQRVLNVPDKLKSFFREDPEDKFEKQVLPRLSSGDESLFTEFNWAVSKNSPNDPAATIEQLRELPIRSPGRTHDVAYDSILLVPVHIDNVHPPTLPRPNALGIDVDADYQLCLQRTCQAYTARYHL